jgi:hypothetical protein
MRDTANFTVFGGVYPAEAHSGHSVRRTSSTPIAAPVAAILFALVIALSATGGAVAGLKLISPAGYGFLPASNMEISGVPTLREVLW